MAPLGVQSVTAVDWPLLRQPVVVQVARYAGPPSLLEVFGRRAQQRELPPPQESDVLQWNSPSLPAQTRLKPASDTALQVSVLPPYGAQHASCPIVQLVGTHRRTVADPSVPPSVVPPSVPVSLVPVSFVPVSCAVASLPDASGTAATSSPPQARTRADEEQVTRARAIQRRSGMVAG